MPQIINTAELKPNEGTRLDRHQIYCGLDSCVTLEVHSVTKKQLDPQTQLIYDFERALQAPVLEMMLRGILTDIYEVGRLLHIYNKRKDRVYSIIQRYAMVICGDALNPGSHVQLKKFFYETMNLPKIYKYEKGQKKLTVNRDALIALQQYRYARPMAIAVLSYREVAKKIGVLRTGIDDDERMRFSWNIGGCVLPTTEVLTPNGWIQIKDFKDGDLAAQWSQNNEISFVPAGLYKSQTEMMLRYATTQIKLTVTPEHRVACRLYKQRDDFKAVAAFIACRMNRISLPISGVHKGGDYSPENPRLLVAALADGSYDHNRCRMIFKKERKIERLLQLKPDCKKLVYSRKGYSAFSFELPKNWPKEKKWGPWVLNLTQEAAEAMADELVHWDGHRGSGNRKVFYTAKREQATWVATLLHLTGRGTVIRVKDLHRPDGSWGDICQLAIKERTTAELTPKHWKVNDYSGDVYCLKVPSTFFLVKEGSFISVTGNTNTGRFSANESVFGGGTNSQNITDELRKIFVADEGKKFAYLDLSQAESRLTAYISGDEAYISACESSDLHTAIAKLIWPELDWSGGDNYNPVADREVADAKYWRHWSYRDLSKRGGHLLNYLGTAGANAKKLNITKETMVRFQKLYFQAFPGIRRMHTDVARELQTTAILTTPLGRKRLFFGRNYEDDILRKGVAYRPQSAVADILNLGMWRVWKHMQGQCALLSQLHDAILIQYDDDPNVERRVIARAIELMTIPVMVTDISLRSPKTREMVLPVDATVGWNWAKATKENVDGLIGYNKDSTRVRQFSPSTDLLKRIM